jgi:hypothetical protein
MEAASLMQPPPAVVAGNAGRPAEPPTMADPTPQPPEAVIVSPKEVWTHLPGIDSFVSELTPQIQIPRERRAVASVTSWEIIRRCYEYGKREDVKARVAALNRLPDGSAKRGRPYTGHMLAIRAVAAKNGLWLSTVVKWQLSYKRVVNAGEVDPKKLMFMLRINPSQLAERVAEIEARLAARELLARRTKPELSPEDFGAKMTQRFVRQAGLETARDDRVFRGILRVLIPLFLRHSYKIVYT